MANRSKGERRATIIRIPVPLHDAIIKRAAEIKVGINDYLVCLLYQAYWQESGHADAHTAEQKISG